MTLTQPTLSLPPSPLASDAERLRLFLRAVSGWHTRHMLCASLGWSERKLRSLTEYLGPDIVCTQKGFKLMECLKPEDFPVAVRGCNAFISQSKKNLRLGMARKNQLHRLMT